MKRRQPKECPKCKSKHFSYEASEVSIESQEHATDIMIDDSEWVCDECGEIFYYRATYILGEFIKESSWS